jgi:hypothetical protein
MRNHPCIIVAALATLVLIPAANGQRRRADSDNTGSSLGVARVSVTDGDVSIRQAASGDEMQARASMPLVADDAIRTGNRSRAEVQLGHANFIRLDSQTEVKIGELGNRYYRLQIVRGTANYSQLKHGEADVDLETPQATVRPLKPGIYRVELRGDTLTAVTVRKGEAEVDSMRDVTKVKKGKTITVRGEANAAAFRTAKAQSKDGFDQWNKRRDDMLKDEPIYRGWGYPPFYYAGYGYPYLGFGYGRFYTRGYHYRAPYRAVAVRGGFGRRGGGRRR